MDRLDAMKIFTRVAELSSFSGAALDLDLPRATVSTQVQALEAHLGTQLLYRTTRKVHLTHDGEVFYARAREVLADMDEMETLFQQTPASLKGRLRIDMPQGLAQTLFMRHLPEFMAQHPELEIDLSCTDRRVDIIAEGFDCVLRVGTLNDSALMARPLGHMELVNVASPDYLKTYGTPQTLEDLSGHRLIHYVANISARTESGEAGFEYFDGSTYQTLPMPGAITVNNTAVYSQAALMGLGIIQVPRIGAAVHLKSGALVEVLPDHKAAPMPVNLIYPRRRHLARRVQVFMTWATALVKHHIET
ncbi:LysR family transcriptional regulator [Asticcacaulis machinosus]|uniref:LysR family transcriptional regulator n=1 Tax=Asticcacaulis machinosus TaxID=2984211 RepID=A0ABT5HKB5_9CAUL|nr:LysR family transcriptional regulator [Asticcacaulis machinosus]MDC7676694.1 LysR family transcriptional regulator [Asticcacaulis machinosus]